MCITGLLGLSLVLHIMKGLVSVVHVDSAQHEDPMSRSISCCEKHSCRRSVLQLLALYVAALGVVGGCQVAGLG